MAGTVKALGNRFFIDGPPEGEPQQLWKQASDEFKEKRDKKYPWNLGDVAIVPAYFPTTEKAAFEICVNGFQSKDMTDGNFGRGIYLSTDLNRYATSEAVIVVLANVGNVHVAIESPIGEGTLQGKAPNPSFHSHFAKGKLPAFLLFCFFLLLIYSDNSCFVVSPGSFGSSLPYDGSGESTGELIVFEGARVLPFFVLLNA